MESEGSITTLQRSVSEETPVLSILKIESLRTILKIPCYLFLGSPNNIIRKGKGQRETGSWGEYLDPRGMKMGSGEGSRNRKFIVCTVNLI